MIENIQTAELTQRLETQTLNIIEIAEAKLEEFNAKMNTIENLPPTE